MTSSLFLLYALIFGLSSLACFSSVPRARAIQHKDTRVGLTWLLVLSGGWAAAHVGYLLAPTDGLTLGFYYIGLVIGIGAVGPWLHFCSAYTGRTLHRNPTYRRLAVGTYLAIVGVKLTNGLHGLYFTAEWTTSPFNHLLIHHQPLHWVVMGLAYALSFVGFFMLLELFERLNHDTTPIVVLLALTGAPIILDILGAFRTALIGTTYSPIGVAIFAVGMLYVYVEKFQTIQLAGKHDEPIVILDADDHIRDYNENARGLFPELDQTDAIGEHIDAVVPALTEALEHDQPLFRRERGDDTRWYRLGESPFGAGNTDLGRILTIADVTEQERYRQELERQNERLESFASMISHDLRNPLSVANGHLEMARESDEPAEHLAIVEESHDRMEALIQDVLTLARQGNPIDELEPVEVGALAPAAWEMVHTHGARLRLADGLEDRWVRADPDRLQQLLENLFRNAIEHGVPESPDTPIPDGAEDSAAMASFTVTVGALEDGGFYVEDDGVGIPAEDRETVFDSGYTTNPDGTGLGLAIVAEIVDAHDWAIRATEGMDGGARFEITGVDAVTTTSPPTPGR
ncbi:ATP-binding protein [Natrialbaceae archaeon A-CW2]|uniref:sensor histidine kinase n=1 Tax=Natronosalvus amylolyticus TaxID=2961994 RepID=UPI0020C9956A|nr:ATP-binding protein [Natronosalvus amylolyticus]